MVAVVTGATRGIGEAVARELGKRGYTIVATGRDRARGEEVVASLGRGSFHELDQERPESVDAFATWLGGEIGRLGASDGGGIEVLVNNAGATFDGFDAKVARRTLDVNFGGMMRLTDALLPRLTEGARVVMVSSGMGELACLGPDLRAAFDDPKLDRAGLVGLVDRFVEDVARGVHTKSGWPANAYRVSKVAMNTYARILARELEADGRGIRVNAACPGWVRTAMGGRGAPRSVEEGARTPVWLATLPKDGPTGGFFRDEQPIGW